MQIKALNYLNFMHKMQKNNNIDSGRKILSKMSQNI